MRKRIGEEKNILCAEYGYQIGDRNSTPRLKSASIRQHSYRQLHPVLSWRFQRPTWAFRRRYSPAKFPFKFRHQLPTDGLKEANHF